MKTIDYGEFHRERRQVEIEMNKVFDGVERICFIDTSDDELISMGLNIAGTGKMNVIEAEIFAKAVSNAVKLAKNFKYNDYKKTY